MGEKYWLTNLAAGEFIHLEVEAGADVVQSAKSHLQDSGRSEEVQQGFYVSVHPIPAADEPISASNSAEEADFASLDEQLSYDPDAGVKA